jgi:hypothetical protein
LFTSTTQKRKPERRAPDLPPDVMAELIEKAIRQSYANGPDEPIPALGGKTPAATQTPPPVAAPSSSTLIEHSGA